METLKVGDLAYWDSFAGLVPCKVMSIEGTSGIASTAQRVEFTLTAARKPYKRGELQEASALHVVPRKSVRGQYRNRIAPYFVQA